MAKLMKDGKIALKFDEARGTWKALGEYSPWFDNAIDIHTKDIFEPYHNAWRDVCASYKRDIPDRMLVSSKFYSYKFVFKLHIINSLTI